MCEHGCVGGGGGSNKNSRGGMPERKRGMTSGFDSSAGCLTGAVCVGG